MHAKLDAVKLLSYFNVWIHQRKQWTHCFIL